MTAVEQSLVLTPDERAILSRKRTRALVMAPAMAVVAIVMLLLMALMVMGGVFTLWLITLLVLSLSFGIKALFSTISFFRLNADLRGGQKSYINAPVEAQDIVVPSGGGSAKAYTFWVRAGGRKIIVSEEQYYKVKKGDVVQAHVAPNSGTVFGISPTGETVQQTAAPIPVAPPKPISKRAKRIVITAVVLVVVGVGFLAVAGVAVMSMSEKTFNSLNPFAPKLPDGAFPPTIGSYVKGNVYYGDHRSYGNGYEFNASYRSSSGAFVSYSIVDYGSADKVGEKLRSRSYFNLDDKITEQSAGRVMATNSSGSSRVLLAAGHRLVVLLGDTSAVTDFENHLPYAALGISRPARPVAESNETPTPIAKLLADFAEDKIGARRKYADKPLLYSGTVKIVTLGLNATTLVGLQAPTPNILKSDSVTAIFPASETAAFNLKAGQEIKLTCSAFVFKDTGNFSTLGNCKLE